MIRRISTKWVLAVLAVVVVPFLGFTVYVDRVVSERYGKYVEYHLTGHAADLSERLDIIVKERRQDAQILVTVPEVVSALVGVDEQISGERGKLMRLFDLLVAQIDRGKVQRLFDRLVAQIDVADYVLLLDRRGEVVVTNGRDPVGGELADSTLERMRDFPWDDQPWFRKAWEGGGASFDVQEFGFVDRPDIGSEVEVSVEDFYHFGFAQEVRGSQGQTIGLVVTLAPWAMIQREVEIYGVRSREGDLGDNPAAQIYESTYAWVWASDADTILAHKNRSLYGEKVSGELIDLQKMVDAANESPWGMYPDYEFKDANNQRVEKKAAFKHGRSQEDGGFGWIVGVGVDYPDIYGSIQEFTATIAKVSAFVLLLAIVVTVVIARRTTRPVQDLEAFTRQVASGNLDAQIAVRGHDELADLARSFNRMTGQLKENRAQLIEAEKDAAWREMARQVAHEIKNPLTPIQLSVSLLQRAHDEDSPEFPQILDRTIDVVQRQVRNMRDIAQDFYRFAGEHRDPEPVDAALILDEVFELNAAWAEAEGVRLERVGTGVASGNGASNGSFVVQADPDELRRAFVNLVSNAIEATGEGGGSLRGEIARDGADVRITIQDAGRGIDDEVAERLFEPYFTTRSSGTGLGLAIVRRIIEDLGGRISLVNVEGGVGAIATIWLPHHEAQAAS